MRDLFGDPRVQIPGNKPLEIAANLILDAVENEPHLTDGDRTGIVDRQIMAAVWLNQGLAQVLGDKAEAFRGWFCDPSLCAPTENLRRARQYLVEQDMIRLSRKAIQDGERHRKRIVGAMR